MEAEVQLLARCRRGDSDAWDELFDRHYAAAGRFVFQLASDFTREDEDKTMKKRPKKAMPSPTQVRSSARCP